MEGGRPLPRAVGHHFGISEGVDICLKRCMNVVFGMYQVFWCMGDGLTCTPLNVSNLHDRQHCRNRTCAWWWEECLMHGKLVCPDYLFLGRRELP